MGLSNALNDESTPVPLNLWKIQGASLQAPTSGNWQRYSFAVSHMMRVFTWDWQLDLSASQVAYVQIGDKIDIIFFNIFII